MYYTIAKNERGYDSVANRMQVESLAKRVRRKSRNGRETEAEVKDGTKTEAPE